MTQPLDLVNEEVDVRLGGRGVGDDHTEEVDFIALRLVAHHGGAWLHHHGLDLWRHLEELAEWQIKVLQSWRESFKTDVNENSFHCTNKKKV